MAKPCYKPYPSKEDRSLGAELKRKRLDLNWSQQETAHYFGILKDSYQKWEQNKGVPHVKHMKKVVEFLGYHYWNDGSNSLANKCLLYRIEKGIVRKELAQLINVSEMTMYRIENKNLNISKETIYKIKRILKFK